MPKYVASFKISLPVPIDANTPPTRALEWSNASHGVEVHSQLLPTCDTDRVSSFSCSVCFNGPGLTMIGSYPNENECAVLLKDGQVWPPQLEVVPMLANVLRNLSALTMQHEVAGNRLVETLLNRVSDLFWDKPDGQRASGICVSPIMFGLHNIRDVSRRPACTSDWDEIQALIDQKSDGAPAWRKQLADAYRDREWDIRSATRRAATALDVALQPSIKSFEARTGQKDVKPLHVLRGEFGCRTPSLALHNPALFADISHLWYTRHGIVHNGSDGFYDKNPQRYPIYSRLLTGDDVERFILAVMPCVEYVIANPP